MKSNFSFTLLLAGIMATSTLSMKSYAQQAEISVDASKVENKITPWLYGACIEDVNHEIYGGLYDQKIFGESFEEPAPSPQFSHFTPYDGTWNVNKDILSVTAFPGAKLVYNTQQADNGTVEAELKFDKTSSDNAGLLVRVNDPNKGADRFAGYEISLRADGQKIIVGKHQQDWQHIKDIDVKCSPLAWNHLKVKMQGATIEIILNGKNVFMYEDKDAPLLNGKIALRTWNADAKFRNIKINAGGKEETLSLQTTPSTGLSSQWDALMPATPNIKVKYTHDGKDAFNGNYSQQIDFIEGTGNVGISNSSLNRWGIAVEKGQRFEGRFYLKATNLKSTVKVALQSADGQEEYAVQEIKAIGNKWNKYTFDLTANTTDKNARFALYITEPGKLSVEQVTLMATGDKQFKGLPVRNDIGQKIVDQGLTFLGYGGTMINIPGYRFKNMIGDPDKRTPYKGHWYPYSTNGFGIEDFLQYCEAAGFTAAFAINIEETPQDMADMIEYLNGSPTSVWGKKRADNGHPAPYNVKYIGIGNEEVLFNGDKADEYDHYIERFNLIYDAIKSKDPSVSLVNTAWWRPESPSIEKVFRALDGKADYWDYHPWADQLTSGKEVEAELRKMKDMFLKWNPNTTMKCAIFEENGNTHNMERVLGHVTLQNAVRRMGDFVLTSCAANALQPYKQNDNGWDQGQIFFTPSQVWGIPPFYAQQMAAANHKPLRISSQVKGELDVTATRDEKGQQIVLHVANIQSKTISAAIKTAGFENATHVKAICLSGKLSDANSPEQPERIIPVVKQMEQVENLIYDFPPHTYTILVYSK